MTEILILDGGLGTSLEQSYGVTFSRETPLWSSHLLVSDQATLLACQRDFGTVPVDILLTATYQVCAGQFHATRTAEFPDGITDGSRVAQLIADAVSIAERAKGPHAAVALSMGPYGACMVPSQEYSGTYDIAPGQVESWHRERMDLLAQAIPQLQKRVRFLALETIPRVDEIRSMRRALVDSDMPRIPFWMSCLFPGEEDTLPDGTSVEDAVRAMLDPDVSDAVPFAVGVNCTKAWKLERILRRYEGAVRALVAEGRVKEWPTLVVYPDGTNGEVYDTKTQRWEVPEGREGGSEPWHEMVARAVRGTVERGEWDRVVVGGCCMASRGHIARLRGVLKA